MKIFILIAISLTITNFAISQVFGKYVPSFVEKHDENEHKIDKWSQHSPKSIVYYFKKNAVGIGKSFQLLDEILKVNNLKRSEYAEDKSIIAKGLDRWDYENLYYSIMLGKSEINTNWVYTQKDGQINQGLSLVLTQEGFLMMILNN